MISYFIILYYIILHCIILYYSTLCYIIEHYLHHFHFRLTPYLTFGIFTRIFIFFLIYFILILPADSDVTDVDLKENDTEEGREGKR